MEAQKTISTTFRQYLLVLQHNIQCGLYTLYFIKKKKEYMQLLMLFGYTISIIYRYWSGGDSLNHINY